MDRLALARILAVQGRKSESLRYLKAAVGAGWLPAIPSFLPDLAADPPLATLRGEPEFERIRRQLAGHFAKERAELGQVSVQ